jgi:hypothetical protein
MLESIPAKTGAGMTRSAVTDDAVHHKSGLNLSELRTHHSELYYRGKGGRVEGTKSYEL